MSAAEAIDDNLFAAKKSNNSGTGNNNNNGGTTPMDLSSMNTKPTRPPSVPQQYRGKLTQELKELLKKENRCFYCRAVGCGIERCPYRAKNGQSGQ
eukprot:Nk52_evm1s725 gene=Nk52_evmTU1s725